MFMGTEVQLIRTNSKPCGSISIDRSKLFLNNHPTLVNKTALVCACTSTKNGAYVQLLNYT